jgi:hypothetical protein
MTFGHDQSETWSNQAAGPPQGLIWQFFTGKKYTEAKPKDFLPSD